MEVKYQDGVPCDHKGCLSHITQRCEGCGRIGGVSDIQGDRLKEIHDRLNGYSVVLKKDMMFLLAALQEAQDKNNKLSEEIFEQWKELCSTDSKLCAQVDLRISLESKLEQAEEREHRLRTALEFYADDTNWQSHFGCISEADNDEGVIARAALKQEENHE